MFYKPQDGHGLPHNPFNAIIAPRPIGWISSRGENGADNLAPYSFFNGVAYTPPQVMFATTSRKEDRETGKDSLDNILQTGVFCVNIVEFTAKDVMNITSEALPKEIDEFTAANLEKEECQTIACSRVANAPASLECKLVKTVTLPGPDNTVAFGEVVGIHLRDDCIIDGKFDITKFKALARLGYRDYTVVEKAFTLARPDD